MTLRAMPRAKTFFMKRTGFLSSSIQRNINIWKDVFYSPSEVRGMSLLVAKSRTRFNKQTVPLKLKNSFDRLEYLIIRVLLLGLLLITAYDVLCRHARVTLLW